ncbi:NeuD/PglB/VioB family sugar acetyltransferase [Stutzerimonas nitrititolerans]|uniref:NeuD/PglB/VioB family sugar acetyltransferase n=1 Tax=Stutzerimonas nitrititolerans TaxID=2482751 RepID=UPI0028AFA04A|nr:NeuD/PglB/VioB family sugar acetyltransferase [Stutzerimonas nitrititolerans]
MTSAERIILVGGGGHCRSVIDVIEQQGKYKIDGIVDLKENIGEKVLGYPVIACDNQLRELFSSCKNALITVGHIKTNSLRLKLYESLKGIGYKLPVITSPLAYVSRHAQIGEGTVIMHHALVNANANIGKNCIINSKALIEHDAQVGDHCHVSTASVLNGGVVVENNTFVGSNSTSKQEANLMGFIKAGSLAK